MLTQIQEEQGNLEKPGSIASCTAIVTTDEIEGSFLYGSEQFIGDTRVFEPHDALFRAAEAQEIDAPVPDNFFDQSRRISKEWFSASNARHFLSNSVTFIPAAFYKNFIEIIWRSGAPRAWISAKDPWRDDFYFFLSGLMEEVARRRIIQHEIR